MIEYEATYPDINKDEIRERLKTLGATMSHPEVLMKRLVFYHPGNNYQSWVRLRDEGHCITLSYKNMPDLASSIEEQKEICLQVDNFDNTKEFLLAIGCRLGNYQETKRETWNHKGVEITLDEWPFLPPFVEIEGESEDIVKEVSSDLGFDYSQAIFGNCYALYSRHYNIPLDELRALANEKIDRLIFEGPNPFEGFRGNNDKNG